MRETSKVREQLEAGNELIDDVSWPGEGLEPVDQCPVCGSSSRSLLHKGLIDNVAFCAPGRWRMQQCRDCGAAYLDPRPSPEFISMAYRSYHTHTEAVSVPLTPGSWFSVFRRALLNGYRNWRYGAKFHPALKLGIVTTCLRPHVRQRIDLSFRFLPRVRTGARLLDVGFGNGEFLELARGLGWNVSGVDMDSVVVNNAKQLGLDVRLGGIEVFMDRPEAFDVISINHVIEHVYDPVGTLRIAFSLLKPGGQLWLDTPNADSFGHDFFGANWRGIEAPRHLVLFGHKAIKHALLTAGFGRWKFISRAEDTMEMFAVSEQIRRRTASADVSDMQATTAARRAAIATRFANHRAEYITLIAWKPV